MKTCPECGIALKDEYQFCPEDGASLDLSSEQETPDAAVPANARPAAVVLYCSACAAEYPLTFSECPVHHTALIKHGFPSLVDQQPRAHRLHLVAADSQSKADAPETAARRSGIEAYEAALENLVVPAASDEPDGSSGFSLDEEGKRDDAKKYRTTAMAVAVTLALLALVGIYALISNAARKPAKPVKSSVAANTSAQPTVTVQTPQAALDYQDQAPAATASSAAPEPATPTTNEARADARVKPQRDVQAAAPSQKMADSRSYDNRREPFAPPAERPTPALSPQPAMVRQPARQPAATELVLPRGTFGQVAARLTNVRASRTTSGYRYELTFHLADQAGQATQWERLAIVTRSASGATRQQQIPFYHRLGADGTMSFTVSVEMPGRAPADWQGRIICTSIGSDSNGRAHRASFGANVSPN